MGLAGAVKPRPLGRRYTDFPQTPNVSIKILMDLPLMVKL